MMGLRLIEGVDLEATRERLGLDVGEEHGETLSRHAREGLVVFSEGRVRLTTKGLDLASHVLRDLLPDEQAGVEIVTPEASTPA